MDFWPAYFKESLGNPWVIQPEGLAPVESSTYEPKHSVVFVSAPFDDPSLKEMMEKMAVAIKLNPGKVSFEVASADEISSWSSPKKVMVFGKDFFPQHFGQSCHLGEHKLMVTHSLVDLKATPDLKKETWEHLKTFARMN